MKELQRFVGTTSQTMPLFTKLREIKAQTIQGVPVVDSDDDQEPKGLDLTPIIQQLHAYKLAQAKEVAKRHRATQKSISEIVLECKERYQREAIAIIEANLATARIY